jgi:ankyrin repeat protein
LANISILHLLLSIKKDENTEEEQQEKEDKHLYECLQIKDHTNLTPIHWAATQESVSKQQKVFAYLDKRMPGVLDSRYNINWFNSWAKTHPWVIEQKSTKDILSV